MTNNRRLIEDLNLIDNMLFTTISSLEGINQEFYSLLLPIILGKKIRVLDVIPQQIIPAVESDRHGIQIDAYVQAVDEDVQNGETDIIAKPTIYDIEPSNLRGEKDYLPRRNRFYTGIIDVQKLRSGAHYDEVPDLVVINILSLDPFGKGELWYEARNSLITHPEVPYEDGVRHIYLYCNGTINPEVMRRVGIEDSETLRNMLQYFCNSKSEYNGNPAIHRIDELVRQVKARQEVSIQHMISLDYEYLLKKEAKEEGLYEGTQAARSTDIDRMADYLMLHNTSYTKEQALAEATACLTAEDHVTA